MVSFDGGAVAQLVYAKRHITLKRLEVFLTPNKAQIEDVADDSQRSTLRRNVQRYLLANLRFQHTASKNDLLEQQKIIRAFFEYVKKDPRDLVLDIIKAIERNVIQDSDLSRTAKTRFFNRWNLERLVTLYGYDKDSDEPVHEGASVAKEIHKVLMVVCTDSKQGVLLPETGWYPHGTDPETLPTVDPKCVLVGLEALVDYDTYHQSVPVRNGTLSYLIQVLRPDVDAPQIELLVSIFRAAPELVADFFTKKTMFVTDPKPTPSWMAESSLLYSTVDLPVPAACGWKDAVMPIMPPPVSVVIENILPRPLSRKTLTRCLNQNAEFITFYAVRVLTISMNKLRTVLKIFHSDHGAGQLYWRQASQQLVEEFCYRCPATKDVILLYKRTSKDDLQQQTAVAELLACFYEIVPRLVFREQFDVSLVLVDVLKQLEQPELGDEDTALLLNQLRNLLKIARQSPSMRWWQKPGKDYTCTCNTRSSANTSQHLCSTLHSLRSYEYWLAARIKISCERFPVC